MTSTIWFVLFRTSPTGTERLVTWWNVTSNSACGQTESMRTDRRGSLDISCSECLRSSCQQNIASCWLVYLRNILRAVHTMSLHCESSAVKHCWHCGIVGVLWTTLLISPATCLHRQSEWNSLHSTLFLVREVPSCDCERENPLFWRPFSQSL